MQPSQLGPYTIGKRLGHGGMGAVYEAVDSGNGETVAIKLLASHLADDPGLRRRFEAEIETLKSLRHPGIVQLLAFGEEAGQPYFAMELVRGQSLDRLLRAGRRFTWQEAVAAALAITRALKVAHDHGVIHRDLKPANLLVPDDGPVSDVKLADFGIAKLFGGASHTALGNVVGTAEYMAPEQAAGRPLDARADLYALGLVMFAMLTGKPPFRSANAVEVMRMQQSTPPPRLTTLMPEVPAALGDLIHRLLAKEPMDRPASALALGRLLAAVNEMDADDAATAACILDDGSDVQATTKARRPDASTLTLPVDQPPQGVDLLAPTRDLTAAAPAPGKPRDPTRLPTDVAAATTQVDHASRTRFTTLEQLERETAAAARQARRRERRLHMASAITIVSLLAAGGYLLFKPLTADDLHARIVATLAATPDRQDNLRDAEPYLEQYLRSFPDDDRAAEIHGLKRELDVDRLRIRADLREKRSQPPHLRIERDYRLAMALKTTAPEECVAALQQILAAPRSVLSAAVAPGVEKDELARNADLWQALVGWQIEQLKPITDVEQRVDRQDATRKRP